jgi:hypothetical protein
MAPVRSTPGTQVLSQGQVNPSQFHLSQLPPQSRSTPVIQAPVNSAPVTQVCPSQVNPSHSSLPQSGVDPSHSSLPQSGLPQSLKSAPSQIHPSHPRPPQSGHPQSILSAPIRSTPVTHVRPQSGRTGPGQVHSVSHVKSRPQQCKSGLPLPGRAPPMACRQQQCNPPHMARAGVQPAA